MDEGLARYVSKLERSMAEGDALMAARDPATAARTRQRCIDAVMLVGAYQLYVHRELFEPLMRSGDERQRKMACELKAECIALTDALHKGIKNFMAQEMPFDWEYLAGRVEGYNSIMRTHLAKVRSLATTIEGDAARAA